MKRTSLNIRRVVQLSICMIVILSSAQVYLIAKPTLAADQKTWGDISKPITVSNGTTITDYQYNNFLREHEGVTGNQTCEQKTLSLGPENSGMGSYAGCWYDTTLGLIERGGSFVKPKGQPYVGLVNQTESRLLPTPNPDVFAEITNPSGDYATYYVNFRTASDGEMVPTDPEWDVPFYSWAKPAEHSFITPDGSPWQVDDNLIASQIGYSNDGRWMSIWENQGYVAVVNLNTFKARAITVESASIAEDDQDFATTTVSNGGRYLAVGIFGKPVRVIDLDNCATDVAAVIAGGEECNTGFLGIPLDDFTQGEVDASWLPRFYEEGLLGTYGPCPSGVSSLFNHCEYLFRAPNTASMNYIALGDSYASGEGEGNDNFYPETDIHGVNMCHLAKNSYPFLIGKDLQLDSTHSVACSGAKILNLAGNGTFDTSLTSTYRTNQYLKDVQGNSLGSWLPGYYAQTDFVKDSSPSIVTISISGNDISFKDILERCLLGSGTCYKSYEDRLELVELINNQFDKLVNLYASIKQSTVPDARIYVIGYPSIVKPNASGNECGDNVFLNQAETTFANDLEDYLNSVIQLAAEKAGVGYVDDGNVFDGHRLCEAGEKAVNGFTFGHDSHVILSNGSFHPTVYGHELLARRIEQATNDFTKPMPHTNDTILNPLADPSLEILQVKKSNRPTYEVVYLDVTTNQYVYRSGATQVSYTSGTDPSTQLMPNSSVRIELHSDPINLGTLTTDDAGNFSGTITIPADTPVGFHVLNFYAMGVDSRMHEITQTIYVTDQDAPAGQSKNSDGTAPGASNIEDAVSVPSISTNTMDSEGPNIVTFSSDSSNDSSSANEAKQNITTSRKPGASVSLNFWPIVGALLTAIILMVLILMRYARKH